MDPTNGSLNKKAAQVSQEEELPQCKFERYIPCHVTEGVFLGSIKAASNKNILKAMNVTHILTVARTLPPQYPNDFVYKVVKVRDKEDVDIAQHFDDCLNFIDEAKRLGGNISVHCFAGRSRSVTIILAYLMKKKGASLTKAASLVRLLWPQAGPNPGFMRQLKDFEKSLKDGGAELDELVLD